MIDRDMLPTMKPTGLACAALIVALGISACTPIAVTSQAGVRAETRSPYPVNRVYRADGYAFPTKAARDAYLRDVEAKRQATYGSEVTRTTRKLRREARLAREERRLLEFERARLEAERAKASADRARRQAERATRRARATAIEAQERTRARQADLNADRAVRDARRAQRLTSQAQARANTINARAARVDRLAPRPGLAPATQAKIRKYSKYRRKGETVPAFVMRIAEAERREAADGVPVDYWLDEARGGRRERSDR
ncbi:MAG: hypothetical protein AAGD13_19325 [Pseudomonadota bacterium]